MTVATSSKKQLSPTMWRYCLREAIRLGVYRNVRQGGVVVKQVPDCWEVYYSLSEEDIRLIEKWGYSARELEVVFSEVSAAYETDLF